MYNLKCMQCVGEKKQAEQDYIEAQAKKGVTPEQVQKFLKNALPHLLTEEHEDARRVLDMPMRDAVTLVTQWVQEVLPGGMGMVMTCVAVPVCYEHVSVVKRSSLDLSGAATLGNHHGG